MRHSIALPYVHRPFCLAVLLICVSLSGVAVCVSAQISSDPTVKALTPPPAQPGPPDIKASSAILVDADTGQVLYEKNPDTPRPPASTTKIMTAILLLENTKPTEVLTASKKANTTGGSSLNLGIGEKVTAHDMLYALMLRSANDGCVVVSERIAGSEAKFAEMMTRKAHEIGAVNTVFHNCNGLNENPNRTTARDLSIMARYAFRFPEFNAAVQTKYMGIKRSSGSKDVLLKNHAKFLWHFPGADGVKTGYTVPAGHCFVGAATRNGWRLVSVVLNSPDISQETVALMKYGFSQFEPQTIIAAEQAIASVPVQNGKQTTVTALAQNPIKFIVPKSLAAQSGDGQVELKPRLAAVIAPVAARAVVGTLEVWRGGKLIGSTPLLASGPVERTTAQATAGLTGIARFVAITLGLLGALALVVMIFYGTTIAKTARIRRYRLKALLRDTDQRG
jgi:D-alanyl-D-alanine carboxypeptidase (penicillin-binding protein 5/6)